MDTEAHIAELLVNLGDDPDVHQFLGERVSVEELGGDPVPDDAEFDLLVASL